MKYVLENPAVHSALEARWAEWQPRAQEAIAPGDYFTTPMLAPLLGRIDELLPLALRWLDGWRQTLESWNWDTEHRQPKPFDPKTIEEYITAGERVQVLGPSANYSGWIDAIIIGHRPPRVEYQVNALLLAFWLGQWDLAQTFFHVYRPRLIDIAGKRFSPLAFFNHLLGGNQEAAAEMAERHIGRYTNNAGQKPFFKEIWQGAAQGDEDLFRTGIEKEIKKHDLMWSCKRYASGPIKDRAKPHKTPKYESMDDLYQEIAKDLINMRWGQAYFASAMLSWWAHTHGKPLVLKMPSPWVNFPDGNTP